MLSTALQKIVIPKDFRLNSKKLYLRKKYSFSTSSDENIYLRSARALFLCLLTIYVYISAFFVTAG